MLKSPLNSHLVSAIFLCDKDSPRLAGIIFPLPPVSLAADIGSPSALEEGMQLQSEAIGAAPASPGEVVS